MSQIDDCVTTYRGAVDAWECDQMGYLNVQFFCNRVSRAEEFLFSRLQLPRAVFNIAQEKTIFLKEARVGTPLHVESRLLELGPTGMAILEHRIVKSLTGDLSAYAQVELMVAHKDAVGKFGSSLARVESATVGQSILTGSNVEIQTQFRECGRYVVTDLDLDNGTLRRETIVRLANHAVAAAGFELGLQWGDDGELLIGSAMLEIGIERKFAVSLGMTFQILTALAVSRGKTINVKHAIVPFASDEPVVTIQAKHVFFDTKARKAVSVPQPLLTYLASGNNSN